MGIYSNLKFFYGDLSGHSAEHLCASLVDLDSKLEELGLIEIGGKTIFLQEEDGNVKPL